MDDDIGTAAPARAPGRTAPPPRGPGRRLRAALGGPVVVIMVLAPFLGEVLSTSASPLNLFLPWNLALLAALYGSGALLCREFALRFGLGLRGLFLLAAAYGVYEEALIVRSWFDPVYQQAIGLGDYGRVGGVNLLLATHLTAFHVAVSIGASIVLVERIFPARRGRPWVGRRGLWIAAVALFVLVPLTYGNPLRGPGVPVALAGLLCAVLVALAFLVPRLPRLPQLLGRAWPGPGDGGPARTSRPRLLVLVTFLATGVHFLMVYTLPLTGLPWPASIPLVLVPLAVGAVLVRRLRSGGFAGRDTLPVLTGVLAFFLLLDSVVGLGGRYDLIAGAVVGAVGLWWLNRRDDPTVD